MRYVGDAIKNMFRQSGLSEPTQDLIASLGGELVVSGERISVDSSLRIADVFSAVSIISGQISTLPLRVFRKVNENTVEAPEHRASYMLGSAPNPIMPAHAFWAMVSSHLLLWGNAFVEKLRDESGLVSELWPLHPATITVEYNADLRQKRYVYEWNGTRRELGDDRVMHIFGFSLDGLYGLSPIQQCRQMLGLAKARERFEGEVYKEKPFITGVIEHPRKLHDTVKLRESWSAIYGGGDRGPRGKSGRHQVAVLEEGATFNQLTAPLADMQFVESQMMSKRNIASMFGLPPSYLGGSTGDSLTYQTVESNKIQLATMAISPVTTNMQKFVNADLGIFPFQSWYSEFVLAGMLRGDTAARGAFYKALSDTKAIVPNEIRGLENMPPLPGGNDLPVAAVPPALAPPQENPVGE